MSEAINNGVKEIKDYFSTPERPVTGPEMMEFWKSLTEAQKEYYRTTPLV